MTKNENIKLCIVDKWVKFETITWSGSDNQASREITFTLPSNPYDKNFEKINVKLGDLVYLYNGKDQLFLGTVTDRQKPAEAGATTYTARDFMHYLLRSNTTKKFKKKTPEKITTAVCKEVGIGTTALAKTKLNIPSIWFEDQCIYDIIIKVYRKAKAQTNKKYMPVMVGKKLSVIEKGKDSKVTLDQAVDITSANYHDTTDNMIDLVRIYNSKMKQVGKVDNKKQVATYGTYQATYKKEKGVDAKKEAKAMLVGITKEASVEAVGDIRAIAGRSLEIHDKATGLSGKFYIQSDQHNFQDGVHTMTLELSWSNTMEESSAQSTKDKGKKEITNKAKAYYLDSSSVYHSSKSCSACKGKNNVKTSTVEKMKKIKIEKGKNKGKRKYKACAKCWIT